MIAFMATAHTHTLPLLALQHLALLAAGPVLRRLARQGMQLPPGQGIAIFEFQVPAPSAAAFLCNSLPLLSSLAPPAAGGAPAAVALHALMSPARRTGLLWERRTQGATCGRATSKLWTLLPGPGLRRPWARCALVAKYGRQRRWLRATAQAGVQR